MANTYNFPSIAHGDTMLPQVITLSISYDGSAPAPLSLVGASVCMQLRKTQKSSVVSHNFQVSITDAEAGVITIDSWDVDVHPGFYLYDLVVKLADGQNITLLEGDFNVTPKISRCLQP